MNYFIYKYARRTHYLSPVNTANPLFKRLYHSILSLAIATTTLVIQSSLVSSTQSTQPTPIERLESLTQNNTARLAQLMQEYDNQVTQHSPYANYSQLKSAFLAALKHDAMSPHSSMPSISEKLAVRVDRNTLAVTASNLPVPTQTDYSAVYKLLKTEIPHTLSEQEKKHNALIKNAQTRASSAPIQYILDLIPALPLKGNNTDTRDQKVLKAIIFNSSIDTIRDLDPALSQTEKDVIRAAQYILHGKFSDIQHTFMNLKPNALPEQVKIKETYPRAVNPYCASIANRGGLRATYHSEFMRKVAGAVCSGIFCTLNHPKAFKEAHGKDISKEACGPWPY